MQLEEQAKRIKNREDFIAFVRALQSDLKHNPDSWTNKDLSSYLEALAAWTEDMDGYYSNHKKPIPSNVPWGVLTDILVGAKHYE